MREALITYVIERDVFQLSGDHLELLDLLSVNFYIKLIPLTRVQSPEYIYDPALYPSCSQRVFQLEHSPCLLGHFSARNPCTHIGCHITSRGDDAFLELNNHFESQYQQLGDDEPHITGAFNLSTASNSLKQEKSADQALLPSDNLILFNDDTNINFSTFGNSSSQIGLPWPEVNLLLQNPGTVNDILAGLPCPHISSHTPYSTGMTDTTCLNALPGEETRLISTTMTPENLFSHDTMPSSINFGDRGSRGSSSPTHSQSDILELQRISAASKQAFGSLTVQHRTIAPKSGPSTPSQQIRFQCPELSCGRSFNRPTDRERHMGIHSKERKFACPEPGCGKRFYRKDKLADHSRRGHRNRKQNCICMADRSREAA